MLEDKKKSGIFATVIASVFVTILASGTAPWWWNKYFADIKESTRARPQEELITPSTSDELKAKQERDRLEAEINELKAQKERDQLEAALKRERAEMEAKRRHSVIESPSQPKANPSQSFSGIHGEAMLEWVAIGVAHNAIIQTNGPTGVVNVSYFHPDLGVNVIIQQDLKLQYYQGNWFYVGSNPRWAHNGLAAPYSPDTFKLAPSPMGGWSIVEVCDTQLVCAPVITSRLY